MNRFASTIAGRACLYGLMALASLALSASGAFAEQTRPRSPQTQSSATTRSTSAPPSTFTPSGAKRKKTAGGTDNGK